MDHNLYTINVDGSNLTRITDALAGDPNADKPTFVNPVWSPTNNKIAFSWLWQGTLEIHVMALPDLMNKQFLGSESRVSTASIDSYGPEWSPDGTQITYECSEDPCDESGGTHFSNPDIYKVNTDGSFNSRLTTDPTTDSYPAFSPGGGKIVFSSKRDGDYDIYIMNADGTGNPQQLTNNRARDVLPNWQPGQ